MAMSVVYTNFNGRIVKENRAGVERYYAPDTLGSTALLVDSAGAITDTFTYWPFGETRSHIGSSITPLTFVGTLGYYFNAILNGFYVRARYYQQALGRWLTIDPANALTGKAYDYVGNSPAQRRDPTGLLDTGCGDNFSIIYLVVKAFCNAIKNSSSYWGCVAACYYDSFGGADPTSYMSCVSDWCSLGSWDCTWNCRMNVCASAPMWKGGSCQVTFCNYGFSNHGCFNWGAINSLTGVLAHELGHCCSPEFTYDAGPQEGWSSGGLCNNDSGKCVAANCKATLVVAVKNSLIGVPRGLVS